MVSSVQPVSFPTISLLGASVTGVSIEDYYLESFDGTTAFVNGAPGQQLAPTAYDSVLGESVAVVEYNNGGYDGNTPGLYIVDYSARNRNGYFTLARFYAAVTDVSPGVDLSGTYYGIIDGDTLAQEVEITKEATGLYQHSDITGDETGLAGVFVHVNNNQIVFSPQPDLSHMLSGTFSSSGGTVDTTGGQTVITYQLVNDEINDIYGSGTVFRFVRQE